MTRWMMLVMWMICGAFLMAGGCASANMKMSDDLTDMNRRTQEQIVTLQTEKTALEVEVANSTSPPAAAHEPYAQPEPVLCEDPAPQVAKRIMVYNATMSLVVLDIDEAQAAIRKIADQAGGFLQQLSNGFIRIKVPAAKLNESVEAIARIGDVTNRSIIGQDVTEQWHDLHIRLANAENAHKRLTELLAKAEKVEDMVKIEKELARLTETIELYKGKLRVLSESVTYSTISVDLNCPLDQQKLDIQVPFPWVQELAGEMIHGTRPANINTGMFKRGIAFELPQSYVKYYEQPSITRAMSAEGVLIKVHSHDNYEGGDLKFWKTLAVRSLTESRAITISGNADASNNGGAITTLTGSKEIGGKMFGYLVAIKVDHKQIIAYEAWGPQEQFSKDLPALKKSIDTLRD